ncbi:ComEA family DNA-binding protein [Microbacteriaceae bacterium VKM Ac-2855]|nr:ComEA family DNA-binding protein [Microbacteriaceae bacterium VKM Ac-2855]
METDTSDGESGLPELVRRSRRREGAGTTTRVGIGAAVVLVLLAAAAAVVISGLDAAGSSRPVAVSTPMVAPSISATGTATTPVLYVHVLGAVADPGLFVLHDGERVVDAIAAAGGFAGDADRAGVNLARVVADGEQIIVPKIGEAPVARAEGGGVTSGGAAIGGLVNLNSATAADLEELPRIGPATAQRILDYREQNGPFGSVDQLLEITGIGEKTLDGFRDQVTV